MPSLEEYLANEYLANQQDIRALDHALASASQTLSHTFEPATGWPYIHEIVDRATTTGPAARSTGAPKIISHGTVVMALTAIGRAVGLCSSGIGSNRKILSNTGALDKIFEDGFKLLAADFKKHANAAPTSSSFGEQNPLTLSLVLELLSSMGTDIFLSDERKEVLSNIAKAISNLKSILDIGFDRDAAVLKGTEKDTYHRNSFVPLRCVLAAKDAIRTGNVESQAVNLPKHRKFFETTLHEQLSFSAIPDSRFDAAELVFSLEGLLLCSPEAVDASLFYRVLEVLGEKQNTSAHWRPSKPFLATETGSIFLPLSVEVANSLMRSISIMDDGRFHDTYTSKSLPLFRRFWSWLQARAVRFTTDDGKDCLGWHSEHTNAPKLVHPWDTSLVMEFMVAFRNFLQREAQTTTLRLSRLTWVDPNPSARISNIADWGTVVSKMEPSLDGPLEKQVYSIIASDFVEGWLAGKPSNFSMLLYGPPGTGKTSVADNLSEKLGMRLITVTVSDFLGEGGANVESRAKAIFQTLEHQRDAVILFDEIDSFLLDRNSELYREQDSLFQFLTPGMLTKFNNLRKAENSIFIIATNYENRIDPAIKRTGRIDRKYLLPLPDKGRRKKIFLEKGIYETEITEDVIRESVFFGYGDIVTIAKSVKSAPTSESIVSALKSSIPATTLDSYVKRIKSDDFPEGEFLDLIRLAADAGAANEIERIANAHPDLPTKVKEAIEVHRKSDGQK